MIRKPILPSKCWLYSEDFIVFECGFFFGGGGGWGCKLATLPLNIVPTSIFHHIELRNAGETAESVSLVVFFAAEALTDADAKHIFNQFLSPIFFFFCSWPLLTLHYSTFWTSLTTTCQSSSQPTPPFWRWRPRSQPTRRLPNTLQQGQRLTDNCCSNWKARKFRVHEMLA